MSCWKVLDANSLRASLLEDYFRSDPGNIGVFTDHGCMECYKGPGLVNLRCSLEIVSRFPSQIVVLKGRREIVAMQDTSGFTTSRDSFVDQEQTGEFHSFCQRVRDALDGSHPESAQQLLRMNKLANDQFRRNSANAPMTAQAVLDIAASFGPDLAKELRTGAPISTDGCKKIHTGILQVAAFLFRDHPDVTRLPSGKELRGSFVFRYALATYLLVIRWISRGGIRTVASENLANDLVDASHVAYATFFDGVLSGNKKLNELYEETIWFLTNVFVGHP